MLQQRPQCKLLKYLKIILFTEFGEDIEVINLEQSKRLIEMVVLDDWVTIQICQWGACFRQKCTVSSTMVQIMTYTGHKEGRFL